MLENEGEGVLIRKGLELERPPPECDRHVH